MSCLIHILFRLFHFSLALLIILTGDLELYVFFLRQTQMFVQRTAGLACCESSNLLGRNSRPNLNIVSFCISFSGYTNAHIGIVLLCFFFFFLFL
eukprot:UN13224